MATRCFILLAFAAALILSRLLLPPRDRSTLRWLRYAWFAALVSYIGGAATVPHGILAIDLLLLCGGVEGARVAVTAFVRGLSEPLVEAT